MLSAISCSTHAPKLAMSPSARNVSLSRPFFASVPIARPRLTPGFDSGSGSRQAASIADADASSASRSSPIRLAGTSPTYVATEYRPPMSGGLRKSSRNMSWWGIASMLFPGSEIAAIISPAWANRGAWWARRAASIRAQASARKASGSVVVPDLLATMKSVASGSRSSTAAATAAGSVESRTRSESQSSSAPNVFASTSGPRLLPPMPATIAVVNPASRVPSPKPSRAAIRSVKWAGASSQPSRSEMACWTRASDDQSDVSFANSRSAQPSSRAFVTASS